MLQKALKIIHRELNNCNIKWAVIGSTNMKLQGIDVKPRDLDIIVKLADLKRILNIFKKHPNLKIEEYRTSTNEIIYKINVKIENINVEIVGEKNSGEYSRRLLKNQIVKIQLDNIEIPCFTLEAEAQAYIARNRHEKAKMIEEFLTSKASSCTNRA